jgi:hypothetical protein
MLKKFTRLATFSFVVALVVSMAVAYVIQTGTVNRITNAKLDGLLDDVEGLIEANAAEIDSIRSETDTVYLEKTRAFAEMIKIRPEILEDYDELCRIRDLLNVDELHVCDAEGILLWGTVKDFYGFDFATGDQTRPLLAILDDPGLEIAQDPQISGTGFYFQYISVGRYDEKGIVQIGMRPQRLEEALSKAAPENILNNMSLDKSTRILLIKDGTVAEEGTHDALMALRGEYARMFDIQASYYRNKPPTEGDEI